jgi:hypothetical protein
MMRARLRILLVVCISITSTFGCQAIDLLSGGDDGEGVPIPEDLAIQAEIDGPMPPAYPLPFYLPDSPWNLPIPSDAEVDPDSEVMIDLLVKDVRTGDPPVLALREWAYTVFVANEITPRYQVEITAGWSIYSALLDVPIPDGAIPDPEGDGHMTVIDLTTGFEYDFWQAKQNDDGSWEASWVNRISLDSDGVYPYGMGARASGFANLVGLIWPEEFEQGYIGHALFLSIPHPAAGGPVWPATESDGRSRKEGAIPEGARLQLDPTLDLDQFDMQPYERIIAEALQIYGAFVGDAGGTVDVKAVNPMSYPEDPYPEGWFDTRWVTLTGIPWEHMRVLEMSPQDPDLEERVEDESIFLP